MCCLRFLLFFMAPYDDRLREQRRIDSHSALKTLLKRIGQTSTFVLQDNPIIQVGDGGGGGGGGSASGHTYVCACQVIHTYACIYVHTYVYTYRSGHTHVCMYIHTYIHAYIHTCTHTRIHTYIHTHI